MARFCPDCGERLSQPNPNFCPDCGESLNGGGGKKVKKDEFSKKENPIMKEFLEGISSTVSRRRGGKSLGIEYVEKGLEEDAEHGYQESLAALTLALGLTFKGRELQG